MTPGDHSSDVLKLEMGFGMSGTAVEDTQRVEMDEINRDWIIVYQKNKTTAIRAKDVKQIVQNKNAADCVIYDQNLICHYTTQSMQQVLAQFGYIAPVEVI